MAVLLFVGTSEDKVPDQQTGFNPVLSRQTASEPSSKVQFWDDFVLSEMFIESFVELLQVFIVNSAATLNGVGLTNYLMQLTSYLLLFSVVCLLELTSISFAFEVRFLSKQFRIDLWVHL